MTKQKILGRLKRLGLKVQRLQFPVNRAPDPPYVIYLTDEDVRGDDTTINRLKNVGLSLELYTDRLPDEALEERIESLVLYDVPYRKNQVPIESENMVQTAYELEFVEKLKGATING
ncbi:hypothetical protein LJC51_08970 [Lachnospiraceae bacterium OttesenSCG-928-J05]|nr:hypothetical protein [Lachnospiraceae bacterium OttesenSCG-928-J05]